MEASPSDLKLNHFELEALLKWVDSFELSRACRKLNRDFSDGVLAAEIVKAEFPALVELHNYAGCCSLQGKLQNWNTLNRKVFKKLQFHLKPEEIEKLANAESNCIEGVLFRLMKQVELVKRKILEQAKARLPEESKSVMTIQVLRRVGERVEQVSQQMICHSKFVKLQEKAEHQERIISELQEKIEDLRAALDWKSEAIKDLEARLYTKKSKSDRKLSMSAIKESLTSLF
jgi:vacuolar-type H+-ATPase subunit I/STV1